MPKIICFDFDDTMDIKTEPYPVIGEPNIAMVNIIKNHIESGDIVILNTMREGEKLQEAIEWLEVQSIVPHEVNENAQCMREKYNNNPRKIYCDINYDDKNFAWNNKEVQMALLGKGE